MELLKENDRSHQFTGWHMNCVLRIGAGTGFLHVGTGILFLVLPDL